MNVPARSAAAISSSPLRAWTVRPSRVNSTSSAGASSGVPSGLVDWSLIGAVPLLDVDQELVAEHGDGRADRGRDGRTQDADRGLLRRPGQPGRDVVAGVEQEVEVLLAALAPLDALHDPLEPARSLAARRALPARLTGEELGDPPGRPDGAGAVVHDDDRARAQHGACLGHLVLAEGEIDLVRAEPRGGHAAGDERLEAPPVRDAAAEDRGVDQVVEGGGDHLELVDTGIVHVAGPV